MKSYSRYIGQIEIPIDGETFSLNIRAIGGVRAKELAYIQDAEKKIQDELAKLPNPKNLSLTDLVKESPEAARAFTFYQAEQDELNLKLIGLIVDNSPFMMEVRELGSVAIKDIMFQIANFNPNPDESLSKKKEEISNPKSITQNSDNTDIQSPKSSPGEVIDDSTNSLPLNALNYNESEKNTNDSSLSLQSSPPI